MDESDILYGIQERLIGDLGDVVARVDHQYRPQLHNGWVFDHAGRLVRGLRPKRIESFAYDRNDVERKLWEQVSPHLSTVQKHVPEITTEGVQKLIKTAGDMGQLVYSRALAEAEALEQRDSRYNSVQDLIEGEFTISRAFPNATAHQDWVGEFTLRLVRVFDYAESLSNVLSAKKGFVWKTKLMGAKAYLRSNFNIDLDLPELTEDLKVARKAVLDAYVDYEEDLIKSRYNTH